MVQLELYGKIDKEASKIAVNARSILLVIAKQDQGFWPRLLRQSGKAPNNIKVDWNKVLLLLRLHVVHSDSRSTCVHGVSCYTQSPSPRTSQRRHHVLSPLFPEEHPEHALLLLTCSGSTRTRRKRKKNLI